MTLDLRKIGLAAGALVAAGGLAWGLLREPPATDEQKLSALVQDVADSAGRRDVSSIVDHLSESFHGRAGSIATRDDVRRLLVGVLLRAAWSRVVVLERRFEVQGDAASGVVRFVGLRGGAAPGSLAQLAPGMDAYEVEARFAREGDAWRVIEASYRPVGPGIR